MITEGMASMKMEKRIGLTVFSQWNFVDLTEADLDDTMSTYSASCHSRRILSYKFTEIFVSVQT